LNEVELRCFLRNDTGGGLTGERANECPVVGQIGLELRLHVLELNLLLATQHRKVGHQ
jgi:hypothetical protein